MMAEYLRFSNPHLLTSIRHLRTFGCVAYVHLKGHRAPPRSHKMAPRAEKGFLVGTEGFNGHVYLVWLPQSKRFVRARDVRFNEAQVGPDKDDSEDIQHVAELVDPAFDKLPTEESKPCYRLSPIDTTGPDTESAHPTPSPSSEACEEPSRHEATPELHQQPTPDPTPGQVHFTP